jgi:thiol:disulfide interchange protein DsbA
MKLISKIFAVLALVFAVHAYAQSAPEEGYSVLNPPQPTRNANKVEVMEFFFYGCPHCFHLHPYLSAWEKKKPKYVEMVYVPTIFNPGWEPMANAYYALELLGKQKQLDDTLYTAWSENNVLVESDKIADFVAQHGVDRQKFLDAYNSFSVQSKVERSKQMVLSYGISGTPTLVVDGKYVITGLQPDQMVRVLDKVVRMAYLEHAGKH